MSGTKWAWKKLVPCRQHALACPARAVQLSWPGYLEGSSSANATVLPLGTPSLLLDPVQGASRCSDDLDPNYTSRFPITCLLHVCLGFVFWTKPSTSLKKMKSGYDSGNSWLQGLLVMGSTGRITTALVLHSTALLSSSRFSELQNG